MLTKLDKLDGMPVVALEEGQFIGLVKRVLFDVDRGRVTWVSFAASRDPDVELWLELGHVVKIGETTMFVDSVEALRTRPPAANHCTDLLERRRRARTDRLLPDLLAARRHREHRDTDHPSV